MRTRPTDSTGRTRPIPLLLTTRARLFPAWAWRKHKLAAAAVTVSAVLITLMVVFRQPPPR